MEIIKIISHYVKTVFIYIFFILILQFCLNTVLGIFTVPEVNFIQTLSGFILYWMFIYFTSNAWSKGNK